MKILSIILIQIFIITNLGFKPENKAVCNYKVLNKYNLSTGSIFKNKEEINEILDEAGKGNLPKEKITIESYKAESEKELKKKRQKVFNQIRRKKIIFFSSICIILITALSGIGLLISGIFISNLAIIVTGSVFIILGFIFIVLFIVKLVILFIEHTSIFPGYFIKKGQKSISEPYVSFKTSDNVTLRGQYFKADKSKQPRGVVLYSYGNFCNIDACREYSEHFKKLGLDVFFYDYRGYNKHNGLFISPSESGLYKDAEAAYKKMRELYKDFYKVQLDEKKIVLVGTSLGASVANYLAYTKNVGAFISIAGFSNIKSVVMSKIERFCPKFLLKFFNFLIYIFTLNSFDSLEKIKDIKAPKLLFHGTNDSIIPIEECVKLAEKSNKKNTEVYYIQRMNHNSITDDVLYSDKNHTIEFLDKYIGSGLKKSA